MSAIYSIICFTLEVVSNDKNSGQLTAFRRFYLREAEARGSANKAENMSLYTYRTNES